MCDAVISWDTPVGRAECRRIFAAAASLHAAFAGRRVDGLCPLERRLSLFAPRTLHAARARETAELNWWVDQARHALDLGLL